MGMLHVSLAAAVKHSFSASVADVRSCILMGMLHVSLAAAVKHSFSASVVGR